MPHCRPGDLAIVINAHNRCNLGHIVRVVAAHDGTGDIRFDQKDGHIWLVTSASPLTWTTDTKRFRRKTGPAPDKQLQPIRGTTPTAGDTKIGQRKKKPAPILETCNDR